MRKLLIGAAALVLSGSMAVAGEGLGLKIEVGVDVGVVEKVASNVDIIPFEVLNHSGTSMLVSVTATEQFTAEWSASLRIRGVFGVGGTDSEVAEVDADTSFDAFDIGALAGYTFKAGDRFAVTPVLGLSWRTYSVDGEWDFLPVDASFDASLLTLDFGAKAAVKLTDKFSINGSVVFSLPLAGSNDFGGVIADDTADLGGGFLYAIGAAVEYKLTDMAALTAGLAYEAGTVDWEWDKLDSDGDDDLSRFSIQLGATFTF
jgi:hypothetical protein